MLSLGSWRRKKDDFRLGEREMESRRTCAPRGGSPPPQPWEREEEKERGERQSAFHSNSHPKCPASQPVSETPGASENKRVSERSRNLFACNMAFGGT